MANNVKVRAVSGSVSRPDGNAEVHLVVTFKESGFTTVAEVREYVEHALDVMALAGYPRPVK